MYGLFLTLLILDGIFLSVVVLLQSGKGGGLAAMGGGGTAADGIMGGRQASTLLVRATWWSGGIFMFLALVLAILSSRAESPTSILQQDLLPSAPAPVLPGAEAAPPTGLEFDSAEPVEEGSPPDGL